MTTTSDNPDLPPRTLLPETTMNTLSQTEALFSQVLMRWADRISCTMAAVTPKHRADQIAADVAASGNPSGT
jgi:hypothetical protein